MRVYDTVEAELCAIKSLPNGHSNCQIVYSGLEGLCEEECCYFIKLDDIQLGEGRDSKRIYRAASEPIARLQCRW